jgi:ABC-type spermidine/putrescine transport system permease subunit II
MGFALSFILTLLFSGALGYLGACIFALGFVTSGGGWYKDDSLTRYGVPFSEVGKKVIKAAWNSYSLPARVALLALWIGGIAASIYFSSEGPTGIVLFIALLLPLFPAYLKGREMWRESERRRLS